MASAAGDGIVHAFTRLVAQRSSRVIVVSPGRQATVGDVDGLSNTLVSHIASARLPRGSIVGLAAPNGPAFLTGFMALRRAGHTVLLLDPLAPPDDRARAAHALGAAAVLGCAEAWPKTAAAFHVTRLDPGERTSSLSDVAVVKLTSGSTGTPRGVAMRAEQLIADESALFGTMGLRVDDRLLGAVPFSHSYGFTTLALSALIRGLTVVIPADRSPFAPLAAARDCSATVFPTVPAYIQTLLKFAPPPPWPASIRLVISAGAPLSAATAAAFRRTYAQPVHVFYGSSECGGICYDREGDAAERGSVGTPVDGVRVSMLPLEPGDGGDGVVVVESAAVGETYLPGPDRRLHAGRFETSDIGVWRDGGIALLRRIDRVINVRGRKVDPSEVEMVLSGLEGVSEVAVLGMASPDGRDEIVRAVVACPSGRPNYRDFTAWCRRRLADHKVPRSVVFVDALPRTPRGKIDRLALLELRATDNDPGLAHG